MQHVPEPSSLEFILFLYFVVAGIKVHETRENELVFEAAVRWAGNPNITLVLKLLSFQITLQVRRSFKPYQPYPNNSFSSKKKNILTIV